MRVSSSPSLKEFVGRPEMLGASGGRRIWIVFESWVRRCITSLQPSSEMALLSLYLYGILEEGVQGRASHFHLGKIYCDPDPAKKIVICGNANKKTMAMEK